MNSKIEDGKLIICLDGRIDSNNSDAIEKEINEIRNANPSDGLIMDAENLEYVSSAGLRVLLRLKKIEKDFKVINASTEVYDIFEMTGFTEVIEIEKAYRKLSVDGCTVIGRGAKGIIYRLDADTIVKVYINPDSLPDIHKERELARKAFVLGIPTAISYDVVKVGDSYGSVFELLDAKSFSQLIVDDTANLDRYVKDYALLLKQIHETEVKEGDMPNANILFEKWKKDVKVFLSEEQMNKFNELIATIPNRMTMIHGDYHTNNLMLQNDETLLIDMDTLSYGHPIFDLLNVYFTYVGSIKVDPQGAKDFTGIPNELGPQVWEKFIKYYLGTDDQEVISNVENKVKYLNLIRIIRHYGRRGMFDTPEGKLIFDDLLREINSLTEKIDTLDF